MRQKGGGGLAAFVVLGGMIDRSSLLKLVWIPEQSFSRLQII
jgi:hypothetical protein